MKHFIITIAAIAASVIASAEGTNNKTYHTNGAFDNLFVSAGAGVNGILDNGTFAAKGFAIDAAFGKWFTPAVAVRVGYHGLTNQAVDTANGWFAGDNAFGYNYVHADILWNVTNTILGYKESRLIDVIPYYHAGCIFTKYNDYSNAELGTGAGLLLQFRLTSWLDANIDAMANLSREEAWRDAGKIICFPSLTVGLTANFGAKTHTFNRHEAETVTVTIPVLKDCDHEKKIAALEAERDSLLRRKPETVVKKEYVSTGMVTYFVIDKWELTQREKFHLQDLVNSIDANASLTIVGHADKETGSKARNRVLARERVKTVEAYLRSIGFAGQIISDHKGDTANPFAGTAPKNRCVTITVK